MLKIMTNSRRYTSSAILITFLTTVLIAAPAGQDSPKRVRFPTGRTTAVLKGTVKGKNEIVYLLRAVKGQTFTVHITSRGTKAAKLMVHDPRGRTVHHEDGTEVDDDFSAPTLETGDYRIHVFIPDAKGTTDSARFTLEVSIR